MNAESIPLQPLTKRWIPAGKQSRMPTHRAYMGSLIIPPSPFSIILTIRIAISFPCTTGPKNPRRPSIFTSANMFVSNCPVSTNSVLIIGFFVDNSAVSEL